MVEINAWTLVIVGLFSGLGNAAGQWFFQEYLKKHAAKTIETVKKAHRGELKIDKNGIEYNIPDKEEDT